MTNATHTESDFSGAGGVRLFRQSWLPEGTPGGTLAIVHGYGEHSGRYQWVGERLAAAGYAVHAYDLRGYGRSDGPRALVRSFNEHLNDLDAFLKLLRAESGDATPFLLGHSMGGCVAALYAEVRQPALKGLVLSGPAVKLPGGLGLKVLTLVMRGVAKVRPSAAMRPLKAATVSRDPAVVASYESDPLVYRGGIPAGTLVAIGRAITRIQAGMESITMPLLLLHGTADELCEPEGSKQLDARAGSTDKTLKLYEGLAHEVLNEPEKEEVLGDLREWLDARRQ